MKTFLFRAFIICVLIGQASPANIWNDHFKPSITDGFDWTGVAIIGIGVLGVAVPQPQDKKDRFCWRNGHRIRESSQKSTPDIQKSSPKFVLTLLGCFYISLKTFEHKLAVPQNLSSKLLLER